MLYSDLTLEQQEAIIAYCENNNIEPTPENLDMQANNFDNAVNSVLVMGEITGVVGGFTARQLINYTRNQIINNMFTNALAMAKQYDQNLMKVNYNSVCSPLCLHWQNKIYWVSQPVEGLEQLEEHVWKGKASQSHGNLYHPNCRHQLYAYFPGESDPPEDKPLPTEEDYKLSQQVNYTNRTKKKYYKRKETARLTGNGSYEKQKNNWKKWVDLEKQQVALYESRLQELNKL